MKRLILAIAVLGLAACQPLPEKGTIDTADVPPAVAEPADAIPDSVGSLSPSECAARGGKMLAQGRMQTQRCVISYADAGRQCTDGDDCQGDCRIEDIAGTPQAGVAATGRCQVNSSRFGCYTTVEGGKAEATICVD